MSSKPSFVTIIATYHQEVARGGTAGALKRAADRLGVSDETVRRAKNKEQEQPPQSDLLYTPPPDGYPDPVPAAPHVALLCQTPRHKPRHTSPLLGHKLRLRRVACGGTRHKLNENVAEVALPHTNVTSVAKSYIAPPSMYVRSGKSFGSGTYDAAVWLQMFAWGVALLLILAMAASTTSAAQPIRATFAQQGR